MDESHWNFFTSQKHNTVQIKKNKNNHQQNIFLLKYFENCLKPDVKYAKYRNQLEIYQGTMSLKITWYFFQKLLTKPYLHMQKSQE